MDIWLIAATAASGYIAKQLQNVTKGKEDSSQDNNHTVKSESSPPSCLLSRLIRAKKKSVNENTFTDEDNANQVDLPSTSGENLGDYNDIQSDSLFGLMQKWETSSSFRQREFVRRNQRYRRLTKPLSSMESCLMSQFHREQMSLEDYLTSPFPSPQASVSRPLLVTDGSRVISRSYEDNAIASNCEVPRSKKLSDVTVLLQIGTLIGIIASQAVVKQEDELEVKDSLIDTEKAAEENISNIEAELEAELEMLEINLNNSSNESNQDPNGNSSTPDSGNYTVSPRELTLRLHKVINTRLEKRIQELESALEESQMKVEPLESKKDSWSKLWENREVTRTYKSDLKIPVQPLVMNLTGEALDAYNDSYDELMKINDDPEDDDESPLGIQEQELLDFIGLEEEEESSDYESEMEKQLIKQIVEKTKQGSPVVLNAQKLLFLMEDNEHAL